MKMMLHVKMALVISGREETRMKVTQEVDGDVDSVSTEKKKEWRSWWGWLSREGDIKLGREDDDHEPAAQGTATRMRQ